MFLKLSLLLVSIGLVSCSSDPAKSTDEPEPNPDLAQVQAQITEADNQFGLKLFKELVSADPDDNIFISPVSIATALAMTANGAAGKTESELYETLGFEGLSREEINRSFQALIRYLTTLDPTVATKIANSIWYKQGIEFEEAFLQTNRTYFDAEISSLDFSKDESADIINQWVSDETNALIDGIVEKPIDPELVMFLINAIYFKGEWTYQFEDSLTREQNFYNQDGSENAVSMMNIYNEFGYYQTEQTQIVELPYGDKKYSMLVLLPKADIAINDFVASLDNSILNDWTSLMEVDTVILGLPKFTIEYEKSLKEALKALGIEEAFSPMTADFSGMRPQKDLFISEVKHKSFIEVNEVGTEAAAVTSVEVGITSVGQQKFMSVNRPFVYLIRERDSGTILFVGKVAKLE